MKVRDKFLNEKIDKDLLTEMFDISSYWEGAVDFIFQVWEREFESLSLKQQKWLLKLLDDCIEYRIEGKIS